MAPVPAMEVRLMPVIWAPEEHQRCGSRFNWFSDVIFLRKGLIAKLRHCVLLRSGLVEANVNSDLILAVNDVLIGSDSRQRKSLKEEENALFRKMKEDGPLQNSGTYNTLIRAHLRDGDKVASTDLIKEMRSWFTGDASTTSLVTNMLHDGRLEKSFLNMLS